MELLEKLSKQRIYRMSKKRKEEYYKYHCNTLPEYNV